MYLNYRGIVRIMAIFFMVIGAAMLPSAAVSIFYDEFEVARAFLLVIIPLCAAGFFILKAVRPSPDPFKIRDGFLIVSVCWISATVISALPFMISGAIPHFTDAFFESASGLSTTGSSILTDIEIMPKGILFWRSFTHWLGGLGILFIAIALLPALGFDGMAVAAAELTGPTLSKVMPKLTNSARAMYVIYTAFTLIETFMLMLGGLDWFDALTHSFSTIGTGGFSNYNNSIAHFDSAYVDGVITFFMILAGVNFNLYFIGISRSPHKIIEDSEFRTYLSIIGVSTSGVAVYLFCTGVFHGIGESIRYAIFQCVSILTTTGYCTTDFDLWPAFPKMILFMLMWVGGCSSSTGGGIKVIRILVLFKLIKRGILVRLHPNAVTRIKLKDQNLSIDTVQSITGFVFLYFFLFVVAAVLITLDGYDMTTAITASASLIGNIGPGFNAVGPVMNYSIFSPSIKILLSFLMIAGRLEIFTLLMLLSPRFWNPNR